MKRFPINKYISILFCVLILAGQSVVAESFKNDLLKTDIYKTSTGAIRINLYTSKPYADSLTVNKINDAQYVILLPETSNSIVEKTSIEKFADDIKDINIRTQPYFGNFKGYTKITITTNKPVLITPQVLVLNPAAAKKNKETVQSVKNNTQKAPTASKTLQKSQKQTYNTAQKAQAKPTLKTTENKQKNLSKNSPTAKPASKNVLSKTDLKSQKTATQKPAAKPLNKTKQITKTAPIKTTKPKPIAAKNPQPQTVKTAAKPATAPLPKNNSAQASASTPAPKATPVQNPAPTPVPTTPEPAPTPIQQPQPPVMPPANTPPASFLNIYTIGGTALGLLFFLLLIARLRRNTILQRAKINQTDYSNNIDNVNYQEFNPQNTNDLLDSGGSLFSVAQENLSEQEPAWDSQIEPDGFDSELQNGINNTDDSEFEEFSQQPSFESPAYEDFSQQAPEVFEQTNENEAPDYLNSQDIHQEVDDLLASEDLSEDFAPEYAQQAFSEEFSGQNPSFDSTQEQYLSEPAYEHNNDSEFESLENDYQQNFTPEPESPRTIPSIPAIPTVTRQDPEPEADIFGTDDLNMNAFAEGAQNIDEQEFTQIEDGTSLDELNELESQNSTLAEEPSIEELFAEDEKAFEEPLLTEEDLEEKIEIEEEIKIIEPLNQKFDESQIEKIKMPEKFEEVKTVALPEEPIKEVEEISFEQPPKQEKKENSNLLNFEDFETVAQPEEVVRSEFEIDDLRGFYMVDYLDFSILVGHIDEEIFVLKKFEEKIGDKLQARLNETKGGISNYMVKVGNFKALVEVNPSDMKLLIEL